MNQSPEEAKSALISVCIRPFYEEGSPSTSLTNYRTQSRTLGLLICELGLDPQGSLIRNGATMEFMVEDEPVENGAQIELITVE